MNTRAVEGSHYKRGLPQIAAPLLRRNHHAPEFKIPGGDCTL
jgi:hypothetical protein